jgi:hypothetical protein
MFSVPGYKIDLVIRQDRASRRFEKFGVLFLFYVQEVGQGSSITNQYFYTDKVIIHVLKKGTPYSENINSE